MQSCFNSKLEIMPCILLVLKATSRAMSDMRLAGLIHLTVNAKAYNLSKRNLNGDYLFAKGEFEARWKLVQAALKNLCLQELVRIQVDKTGFVYSISQLGLDLINSINEQYLDMFYEQILAVNERVAHLSDSKISDLVTIGTMTKREQR